ncbi:N-acetylgalactosamine-6-phosphate deacetylase [Sphingomonas sp. EC-HK361]|uniref:N-acetylglucosamine-6-phosphate deacetylase n=1 Tax=Sphingomonas sp. EC-HK361 TaxID=2038397 RepID=UPI001253C5F7|nr:N-acetylglucosamine-6-phosphate deacetylase [Sphingomonas sp. EC-HK361]VVT25222.1 N-acetylgalactosamine-6-phosphate deacetylase [Sphingomonas sp. EC-HK361]
MTLTALCGAQVVTPAAILPGTALLIDGGRIAGLCASDACPPDALRIDLHGGFLLPGFIDTQVNGGGGVLFNDAPDVDGLRTIMAAHRRFGTTGMMPTLISDDLAAIERAIDAVDTAIAAGVPGILGIHIEGPFLNADKRGIHDPGKFRLLDDAAIAFLTRPGRGVRLVTLAPELAAPGTIRALRAAGVVVAAGHSMAGYAATREALDEGLSGFTHLFNAMTQLGSREPGMVGAALEDRASFFGLIVDGHHVAPASLRVALAARGPGGAMLVTDAMSPVGTDATRFTLMGREITVKDGVCQSADGTLAGSALSMAQAVRNAVEMLGVDLVTASAMASGNPARFLRIADRTGTLAPGLAADIVHLNDAMAVTRTWIGGALSEGAEAGQAAAETSPAR